MAFQRLYHGYRDLTWSSSATSNAVDLQPGSRHSIYLDSSFAGTSVTIECQEPDGTWATLKSGGTPLTVSVTGNARNVIPEDVLSASGTVRFVSSVSETATGRVHVVQ